ncbi:hypothetical protein AM501_26770 [Aneurinibacillus migulanus]|uniref:hypothetical protein n=1 Tax=Aneurinibacillus migulanus TaxID=47500 RepID=UPI0005BE1CC0|nr:hypothetical protein [Aneurinibacillus migulanus]KIV55036.1 hypothetical protein TS64_12205 [Aneurinibacillus migulanus]KPD05320.1 hypothetical protein AM501_26770 [Aneurinibacillus migulanus]
MKKFKLGIVALIFFIFSTMGVSHAEEKWKDVQLSTYSFQVPQYSEKLPKIDVEDDDITDVLIYDAVFIIKEGAKSTDSTPLFGAGIFKKDSVFSEVFTSVLYAAPLLKDEPSVVICNNDKELIKAIESIQEDTTVISKNKKAVFYVLDKQYGGEKYKMLLATYVGEKSDATMFFTTKAEEFKKNVPIFLKIVATISFKK